MVKQLRLAIAVMFVAILVYSGLWFTAAFQAEKDTVALLSSWRDQGIQIEHGNISHSGFPYRIAVEIEDFDLRTRSRGLDIHTDQMVLTTHLWTANHWVAQISGLEAKFADNTLAMRDGALNASYKLYEDGQRVIAIDSLLTNDLNIDRFFGTVPPQLTSLQLFLRFGDTDKQAKEGLYGERYLDVKLVASTDITSLEATGGISGPIIHDWNKRELENWRDEGGLMEFSIIDIRSQGGRVRGNLSATLDENLKPLGSASMTVNGGENIQKLLRTTGINPAIIPSSGALNIMLQNGRYSSGTDAAGQLKPVLD
ncbi:DUF2125 domain-containing protein [Kordiimonas sp. SCSIO 12603]|uniref:DUF2125 domain-containing protein n=1 Tax=Kordiimonas sp. SCSIO 12603 TaxID=2829596 RepID=UPI002105AFA6|nr:DUF2125 domain-containing protein [Kordiimonas sp. SCSIO 12603]UTW58493.1 DUF2125 domain-containing protein [Kordiimonas sp. SCSIO 12603]